MILSYSVMYKGCFDFRLERVSILSIDDTPTLQQLQQIQGKNDKTIKIIETVAPEWEELAIAMGFEHFVIDTIRRDNVHDAKTATRQLFTLWLNGECYGVVSWERLVECLHDSGFACVAFDVQEMF